LAIVNTGEISVPIDFLVLPVTKDKEVNKATHD